MITEDYVSFETAKLLKKKGFDGPCYKVWESYGGLQTLVGAPSFVEGETVVNRELVDAAAKQYVYEYSIINNNVEGYLAPTLRMAMKWLREKHNILLVVDYEYECDTTPYYFKIYRLGENGKPERVAIKGVSYGKNDNAAEHIVGYRDWERSKSDYSTYEEAAEAAIKYCIENLI